MAAIRLNHASLHADDLDESARFYEELFGMKRLPTPRLAMGLVWLRLGEQQLHIFQRKTPPPAYHHVALDVDDFEAVYRAAKARGALDGETFGAAVREHPAGWVQMYLRDPAGNLVEVDWPDASTLDRSVVTEIRRFDQEQAGDAASATLYHAGAPPRPSGR
jgi:lactoylglutathione lyase